MPLGSLLLACATPFLQDAGASAMESAAPADPTSAAEPSSNASQEGEPATPAKKPASAINPHAAGSATGATGASARAHGGAPPSGAGPVAPAGTMQQPVERKTTFAFSSPQTATPNPALRWSSNWYSLDDPKGADKAAPLNTLAEAGRKTYRSMASGLLILARDIEGQTSPFDAFEADEAQISRFGEFITEADGLLMLGSEELIYLECEWQAPEGTRHVLAFYSQPQAGKLRSVWLVSSGQSSYAALLEDAKLYLPHLMGPLGARPEESYYSALGAHLLGVDLRMHGIELKPVLQPRDGERDFLDSVLKANPQFKVGVVQNWMDEESDVSLSYQVIQHDNGMGISNPFVKWLGGQFQQFHRDSKINGDFPVELIHNENTLTQVLDQETLAGHYKRNKRAPEGGVILGVYLIRSPYARNIQVYWMSSEDETPEYGYVLMLGLRRYVRSRSETIMRNSVAMFMLRGSDPAAIERAAAGLNLRSLPLDEELSFPR